MDVSGRTTQETKSSSYRGDKVEQLPRMRKLSQQSFCISSVHGGQRRRYDSTEGIGRVESGTEIETTIKPKAKVLRCAQDDNNSKDNRWPTTIKPLSDIHRTI